MTGGRAAVLAKDALAGKVAVVTGGGTGIGTGIGQALAYAGAQVVLSPHQNVDGAERTAASLRAAGATAIVHACDVREFTQVQALFDTALREFGRVDILINSASEVQGEEPWGDARRRRLPRKLVHGL